MTGEESLYISMTNYLIVFQIFSICGWLNPSMQNSWILTGPFEYSRLALSNRNFGNHESILCLCCLIQ